jgi:hypothetical protein
MKNCLYLIICLFILVNTQDFPVPANSGFTLGTYRNPLPVTPKAGDLNDHYGTDPTMNIYGPKGHVHAHLEREGVELPGQPITPIENFNQEIHADEVVAGDLRNTSYDARRIISPQLARAKARVQTRFVHDAVVNTPVQYGTRVEDRVHTVTDHQTGQVTRVHDTKEVPIVGLMKNVIYYINIS